MRRVGWVATLSGRRTITPSGLALGSRGTRETCGGLCRRCTMRDVGL